MKYDQKIISELKSNVKVKRYLELEKLINENKKINKKLDELKEIQKQIVHAKSLNKEKTLKINEDKYDKLLIELEETPLLMEYLDLQEELNELLQSISLSINNALTLEISDK